MLRKRRWEESEDGMAALMKRARLDGLGEQNFPGLVVAGEERRYVGGGDENSFLVHNANADERIGVPPFDNQSNYRNSPYQGGGHVYVRRRLNSGAGGEMLFPMALGMNESGRKRPRSECSPSPSDRALEILKNRHDEEVKRLRAQLEYVKTTALNKLVEAERVNQNLKEAFEEQHKEVSRLVNENKILKSGILTLNKKREELQQDHDGAKRVVDLQQEKIKHLEGTVFTLRMHLNQATCSNGGSWSGDDRVF